MDPAMLIDGIQPLPPARGVRGMSTVCKHRSWHRGRVTAFPAMGWRPGASGTSHFVTASHSRQWEDAVVSIIIPTYNSGTFLGETVESVRRQTVDDWELLLVDDGSADDTVARIVAWAAGDGRIKLLRQDHRGPNHARNLGFAASDPTSGTVVFLDHDDVWEADALTTLRGALDAHQGAAAAYGLAYYMDEHGAEYDAGIEAWTRDRHAVVGRRVERVTAGAATGFPVLAIRKPTPTPGQVLIRRAALEQAGPWDVDTVAAADYDLWLRLSLIGGLVFVDRRVIAWRQHGRSFSKRSALVERSDLVVRRKFAFDPALPG